MTSGTELLQDFITSYEDEQTAPTVLELVRRQLAWMTTPHGPRARRSVSALAESSRVLRQHFSDILDIGPAPVESAYLNALASRIGDRPMRARLGIVEVPKQGGKTDDAWAHERLHPQRRFDNDTRESCMYLAVSKIVNVPGMPIVPGPSIALKRGSRPDGAIKEVVSSLHAAHPRIEVIGLAGLDDFDRALATMRHEDRPSFTLRFPRLLGPNDPQIPAALVLPPVPELGKIVLSDGRSLRQLRTGATDGWLDADTAEVELENGTASRMRVRYLETAMLQIPGRMGFLATMVHLRDVGTDVLRPPQLVAVTNNNDVEQAVDMALAAISATDKRADIKEFLHARSRARVLRGEQQTRERLATDRALAAVSFAASRLETHPALNAN